MQALFILKQKASYDDYGYSDYSAGATTESTYTGGYTNYQAATGMWTSSQMVVDVLLLNGISADILLAVDANSIDRLVTENNPDTVFIEGLWATPSKFQELLAVPRHQNREWIVRIHSDMPFLATEGVAFSWIKQYIEIGVKVAPNSQRLFRELTIILKSVGYSDEAINQVLIYLPNCYPTDFPQLHAETIMDKDTLDIACFGAIRVMKNHVMQAFNALEFCKKHNKKLRWHYNDNIGSGGQGPYNNMISMLSGIDGVELVPHEWEDRQTFLNSISNVDLLLQLSLSETMNIVAADATYVGKPIIVSDEISWAYPLYGHPTNSLETLKVMNIVLNKPSFFVQANRDGLRSYAQTSEVTWVRKFIPGVEPASAMSNPTTIPNTINHNTGCCN